MMVNEHHRGETTGTLPLADVQNNTSSGINVMVYFKNKMQRTANENAAGIVYTGTV